jgi:ABC-2 type transport system permease protein
MNIRKYYMAGAVQLYSLRSFVAGFYLSLLYYPAELIILYFIWMTIYRGIGVTVIGGFTFTALISYFVLQRILSRFLPSGSVSRELDTLINSGGLITYLARPVHYVAFKLSQTLFLSAIQTVLGCVSFVAVAYVLRLTMSFEGGDWLAFFPLVIMSLLITFLLDFSVGILAFWLGRIESLRVVYSLMLRLVSGALVPISFFPQTIQAILSLLPFQYLYYVPVSVVIGTHEVTAKTYAIPALWILVLSLVLFFAWSRGLRRFEIQGG